jgi:hypothetical protein
MIGPGMREELGAQRRLELARATDLHARHAATAQPPSPRRAAAGTAAIHRGGRRVHGRGGVLHAG